jgi:hypothetical protein
VRLNGPVSLSAMAQMRLAFSDTVAARLMGFPRFG